MRQLLAAGFVLCVLALPGSAQAAIITLSTDPLLAGANVIEFDEVATGTSDPTILGVSFSGIGGTLATIGVAGEPLGGSFGPTIVGPVLKNQAGNTASGIPVLISFSGGTSAFALDIAAINSATTASAYDAANNLLGTVSFGFRCCEAVFAGLGGFGVDISTVRIDTADYVFIDNVRFAPPTAAVPGPASMLLLGTGLLLAGVRRLRHRRAYVGTTSEACQAPLVEDPHGHRRAAAGAGLTRDR